MPSEQNADATAIFKTMVKQCGPETILRAASLCDGHSILKPEAFIEAGIPTAVVEHMTRMYRSDGSPKGTIFVAGKRVKQLRGIYGLAMLRFLASTLEVEYRESFGRGTEARNIQASLHQHFGPLPRADRSAS
jgi:hypothetical protein